MGLGKVDKNVDTSALSQTRTYVSSDGGTTWHAAKSDTDGRLINKVSDSAGNTINPAVGFEIPPFDYIALTYVAAGNGAGEIETVVYKDGGAGGSIVATLTLAYNADDEISSITQT